MPFNPKEGTMHPDHAALQHAVSEYGKAMEAIGCVLARRNLDAADLVQSPEYRLSCERWVAVNRLLSEHFRKHWFNAV